MKWRLLLGLNDIKCDLFPLGSVTTSVTQEKPGLNTSLDLTFLPGSNLVRITRLGDTTQQVADYDLAVDPPSIELVEAKGLTSLRLAVTVPNPARADSPPATLNEHQPIAPIEMTVDIEVPLLNP